MNVGLWLLIILCAVLAGALPLRGQQKGQYMPGQRGRADIQVGDAFMTPTGRYSPGALNNIGSGYFGNQITMGATVLASV